MARQKILPHLRTTSFFAYTKENRRSHTTDHQLYIVLTNTRQSNIFACFSDLPLSIIFFALRLVGLNNGICASKANTYKAIGIVYGFLCLLKVCLEFRKVIAIWIGSFSRHNAKQRRGIKLYPWQRIKFYVSFCAE